MFSQLRGWEWLIIVALVLLLFGAKRLPDAARGLGRSLRIFKAETKGLAEDGKGTATKPAGELSAQAAEASEESVKPSKSTRSAKSAKDTAEG